MLNHFSSIYKYNVPDSIHTAHPGCRSQPDQRHPCSQQEERGINTILHSTWHSGFLYQSDCAILSRGSRIPLQSPSSGHRHNNMEHTFSGLEYVQQNLDLMAATNLEISLLCRYSASAHPLFPHPPHMQEYLPLFRPM